MSDNPAASEAISLNGELVVLRFRKTKRFGVFRNFRVISMRFAVLLCYSVRCSLLLRRFVFRMAEASAKRVTGDEPQGTMGRVQTAPSRLPLRAHFHQKRDVWVRGSCAVFIRISVRFCSVRPPPPPPYAPSM